MKILTRIHSVLLSLIAAEQDGLSDLKKKKKKFFLTWLLMCPYLAVVSLVVQFCKVFLTAESEHEMKTSIPFQFVDSWKT